MQQPHVICSVKEGLQRIDTLAEKERGKASCNPDNKCDEPELDLSGPAVPQHVVALFERGQRQFELFTKK